jgi:hypothetical protein
MSGEAMALLKFFGILFYPISGMVCKNCTAKCRNNPRFVNPSFSVKNATASNEGFPNINRNHQRRGGKVSVGLT